MFRPSNYSPSCVLVGLRAGTAPRRNATTAWSKTSTGVPIGVTFCTAHPPALSYFYVNCLGFEPPNRSLLPKVISQDADLVVLRVPRDSQALMHHMYSDYFVYRVDCQRPRLDLLPNPWPEAFGDNEIAIVSCNDGSYVVAALQIQPTFKLSLYRSSDGKQGSWTSRVLSVEEPLRDKVCPIPDSSHRHIYHLSTKVITLGGDEGMVGWVDLWRGILLCNVLSMDPKLRDIPLPLPATRNLTGYLNGCPSYFRDITVNKTKDTIKYIEMQITSRKQVCVSVDEGLPDYVIPGSWTANTWIMPIQVTSSFKWHPHCTVHFSDLSLPVGNQGLDELLDFLLKTSHKKEQEATGATLPLGCLCMAYPTLSIDDDDEVVHFLSRGTSMGRMGCLEAVVSVDLSAKTLLGLAVLDTKRQAAFKRSFITSGISNYLNFAGTRATLCRVMSESIKTLRMEGAENGRHGAPTRDMGMICPDSNLIA